jgi:hypothetical protein
VHERASHAISRRAVLALAGLGAARVSGPVRRAAAASTPAANADPLGAWNDGAVKRAILRFVAAVADPASPGFVPPAARLAVFDLDGTLWVERPTYVDLLFAEDRARKLLAEDPALAGRAPYADLLALDEGSRTALSEQDVLALVFDSFAGMTPAEYRARARAFLETVRNPLLDRRWVACAYAPMLELLRLLEANGFTTAIASAGDIDFVRTHAWPVFGIPPERAVGTSCRYQAGSDGEVRRTDDLDLGVWDDGKAVAIQLHLGRRPILCVGNADSDLAMLGWTLAGDGERLALLLHHDDGGREFAYDRAVNLATPLPVLRERGITVVSMKDDFRVVFGDGPGPNLDGG